MQICNLEEYLSGFRYPFRRLSPPRR